MSSNHHSQDDIDHQFESSSSSKNRALSDEEEQHDEQKISTISQQGYQEALQFENHSLTILEQLSQKEEHSPWQKQIMQQIEEKLEAFKDALRLKSTTEEQTINIRIQQLVLNKLLVFTYSKSEFRLVLSHYNLGQSYLRNQCYEQAIEHIGIGLDKLMKQFLNPSMTNKGRAKFSLCQSYMQNFYAKAQMSKGQYEEAIQLLKQSLNIYEKNKNTDTDKQQLWKVQNLIFLSQCYSKVKSYQQANASICQAIEILDGNPNKRQTMAFAIMEKAKIEALKQNYNQAQRAQEEAIEILVEVNYSKPQEVAQMYVVLSYYQENLKKYQDAINSMQKSIKLFQELFEGENKNVLKGKRRVATLLLKKQNYKEAIKQLLQISQIQEKVHGENSLQLGRTFKLLGTIYLTFNQTNSQARNYLRRAFQIFNYIGNKKLANQIKLKLRMIDSGGKLDGSKMKIIYEQQV